MSSSSKKESSKWSFSSLFGLQSTGDVPYVDQYELDGLNRWRKYNVFPRSTLLQVASVCAVTTVVALTNQGTARYNQNMHWSIVNWLFPEDYQSFVGNPLTYNDDTFFIHTTDYLNTTLYAIFDSYFSATWSPEESDVSRMYSKGRRNLQRSTRGDSILCTLTDSSCSPWVLSDDESSDDDGNGDDFNTEMLVDIMHVFSPDDADDEILQVPALSFSATVGSRFERYFRDSGYGLSSPYLPDIKITYSNPEMQYIAMSKVRCLISAACSEEELSRLDSEFDILSGHTDGVISTHVNIPSYEDFVVWMQHTFPDMATFAIFAQSVTQLAARLEFRNFNPAPGNAQGPGPIDAGEGWASGGRIVGGFRISNGANDVDSIVEWFNNQVPSGLSPCTAWHVDINFNTFQHGAFKVNLDDYWLPCVTGWHSADDGDWNSSDSSVWNLLQSYFISSDGSTFEVSDSEGIFTQKEKLLPRRRLQSSSQESGTGGSALKTFKNTPLFGAMIAVVIISLFQQVSLWQHLVRNFRHARMVETVAAAARVYESQKLLARLVRARNHIASSMQGKGAQSLIVSNPAILHQLDRALSSELARTHATLAIQLGPLSWLRAFFGLLPSAEVEVSLEPKLSHDSRLSLVSSEAIQSGRPRRESFHSVVRTSHGMSLSGDDYHPLVDNAVDSQEGIELSPVVPRIPLPSSPSKISSNKNARKANDSSESSGPSSAVGLATLGLLPVPSQEHAAPDSHLAVDTVIPRNFEDSEVCIESCSRHRHLHTMGVRRSSPGAITVGTPLMPLPAHRDCPAALAHQRIIAVDAAVVLSRACADGAPTNPAALLSSLLHALMHTDDWVEANVCSCTLRYALSAGFEEGVVTDLRGHGTVPASATAPRLSQPFSSIIHGPVKQSRSRASSTITPASGLVVDASQERAALSPEVSHILAKPHLGNPDLSSSLRRSLNQIHSHASADVALASALRHEDRESDVPQPMQSLAQRAAMTSRHAEKESRTRQREKNLDRIAAAAGRSRAPSNTSSLPHSGVNSRRDSFSELTRSGVTDRGEEDIEGGQVLNTNTLLNKLSSLDNFVGLEGLEEEDSANNISAVTSASDSNSAHKTHSHIPVEPPTRLEQALIDLQIHGKEITLTEATDLLSVWPLLKIVANGCCSVYCLMALIQGSSTLGDNLTLLLAFGGAFEWLVTSEIFKQYGSLYLFSRTFAWSAWPVTYNTLSLLPVFFAFVVVVTTTFGDLTERFDGIVWSSITLFANANGDVVRETFQVSVQYQVTGGLRFLAQCIMYLYICSFIYVMLKTTTAITEEAFIRSRPAPSDMDAGKEAEEFAAHGSKEEMLKEDDKSSVSTSEDAEDDEPPPGPDVFRVVPHVREVLLALNVLREEGVKIEELIRSIELQNGSAFPSLPVPSPKIAAQRSTTGAIVDAIATKFALLEEQQPRLEGISSWVSFCASVARVDPVRAEKYRKSIALRHPSANGPISDLSKHMGSIGQLNTIKRPSSWFDRFVMFITGASDAVGSASEVQSPSGMDNAHVGLLSADGDYVPPEVVFYKGRN